MSESPLPKSRRKLLKSIALGGGAIAVAKTLPESWTKPVIDSVMLPAHAAASDLSLTVTDIGTNADQDGISILFDGSSFTLTAGDEAENDANLLAFLDVDNDNGLTFDWEEAVGSNHTNDIGDNWTLDSDSFGGDYDDVLQGSHTATVTRDGGSTYLIGFKVVVTNYGVGATTHGDMTVSNLTATVV
jgi:hypothetical protein